MYGIWRVRGGGHAEARRKDQDLPAGFRDLVQPSAVEVQLELLVPVTVPATMPLSWDFSARWFATFGGADRRLTEQGRNRGRCCIQFHIPYPAQPLRPLLANFRIYIHSVIASRYDYRNPRRRL
jgi:hypothetical protein